MMLFESKKKVTVSGWLGYWLLSSASRTRYWLKLSAREKEYINTLECHGHCAPWPYRFSINKGNYLIDFFTRF